MSVYLIDSYYLLYLIRVKANRTFIKKFLKYVRFIGCFKTLFA